MIEGGCHCGACRYAVETNALDDVAVCHCSICRRTTGGTHVTWATVPIASFRWTEGEPRRYSAVAGSERHFCPDCGAQMALWTVLSPGTLDISVTTLDHADHYPPNRHIWVGSRLAWVSLDDALAQEDEENYPD
ncbi:GFA family protein [Acidihalobacter ferrooxydans]|uniref:GFA family protein n=1 Tax=Acidihalobacter ferrooxydans TaxID=1765967 RepID=UPI0018DB1AAA|nr:GFA family protein [Acidihalobacter ferrooxydans]